MSVESTESLLTDARCAEAYRRGYADGTAGMAWRGRLDQTGPRTIEVPEPPTEETSA